MTLLSRLAERRVREIQPTAGACSGALTGACRGETAQLVALPNGERRYACPTCIEAAAARGLHLTPVGAPWRSRLTPRDLTADVLGHAA